MAAGLLFPDGAVIKDAGLIPDVNDAGLIALMKEAGELKFDIGENFTLRCADI